MQVLDIVTVGRAAVPGFLSYRSLEAYPPGTIISVPLRRGETLGVVVTCEPARNRKAELKSASYTLKGSRGGALGALPSASMQAARAVAERHAIPLGAALVALLADLQRGSAPISGVVPELATVRFSLERLEEGIAARETAYRARIEALPPGASALLVVPTRAEIGYWSARLKDLGVRTLVGSRKRGSTTRPARLTIAAPERSIAQWLEQPPAVVLLERAGSGSYVLPARPYLDVRRVHEEYARAYGAIVVLGDLPLPLEYRPVPTAPLMRNTPVKLAIVDARRADTDTDAWQVIPHAVAHRIGKALTVPGARVLLLGVRSGYAPAIVCRDCGQAVVDDRGRALMFGTAGGVRVFRTADGRTVRPADTACTRCGSWNLLPLGIGVERIVEAARVAFPDTPIAALTPTVVSSPKRASEMLALIESGGLVIGTEAALPILLAEYGPRLAALACIVSADSLLALPFWRARERFVRLGLLVADLAHHAIVVTRRPDDSVFSLLANPSDTAFFTEEYALRTALGYPPAAVLITVTRAGTPHGLARLEPLVMTALGDTPARTLPDAPMSGNALRRTTILTVPASAWPNPDLAHRLAALPPACSVRIDPETLW